MQRVKLFANMFQRCSSGKSRSYSKSSPMIHCGNRSFLEVTRQMFESESEMAK
jgi:hypothetical protein